MIRSVLGARRGVVLASTVAAAVLLAGCSGSDSGGTPGAAPEDGFTAKPAAEIVDTAVSAMQDLDYVHLSGTLFDSGTTFTLDMSVSAAGACQGTLGINSGTMQLRSNSDGTWFKGDAPMWGTMSGANGPAAMAAAGDRWVIMPEASGSLAGLCDLSEFTAGLGGSSEDSYAVGGTSEVNGQQVVSVTNEKQNSTAYVLTSSPHLLAQIVRSDEENGGTVNFSAYDEAFTVQTPTDTFDLEAFTG